MPERIVPFHLQVSSLFASVHVRGRASTAPRLSLSLSLSNMTGWMLRTLPDIRECGEDSLQLPVPDLWSGWEEGGHFERVKGPWAGRKPMWLAGLS
jgi:hypothetical protein